MKDLPTELCRGLALGAVLEREDPHDTFVSLKHERLADAPQGARIGTSSMRRKAQLLADRPDLEIIPLRGNVDTRMRKLAGAGPGRRHPRVRGGKEDGPRTAASGRILPFDVMVPPAARGPSASRREVRMMRHPSWWSPSTTRRPGSRSGSSARSRRAWAAAAACPLASMRALSGGRVTFRAVFGDEDGAIIFKDRLEGERAEGAALMEGLLDGLRRARAALVT